MDYGNEFKRLEAFVPLEGSEFWSPKPGQYRIKALGEIEDSAPFDDDEEQKPRKKVQIELEGKKFTWTFALGQSLASTYGQLVQLGKNKGKLKDISFLVIVVGEGKQKRFTIVVI